MSDGGEERATIKRFNYLFRQIMGLLVRAPAYSTYVIPLFVDAQGQVSGKTSRLVIGPSSHVLALTKDLVHERNCICVGMGQT